MGTNFYWKEPQDDRCEHCGRETPPIVLHIGKSSSGWVFALNTHPEYDILSLRDWLERWKRNGIIEDEYGREISIEQIIYTILCRTHPSGLRWAGWADETPTYGIHEGEFS